MSSKLPILLVVAGVIYFISTASAEEGDDVVGCMDETACNYDDTATVDSGDCKYGDACDDDDTYDPPPADLCDNLDTTEDHFVAANQSTQGRIHTAGTYAENKCRITEIAVDQKDYDVGDAGGRVVRVFWNADVYNRSESRCGDTAWCLGGCKCSFAPTCGSNVGANEGHLTFTIQLLPTMTSQVEASNLGAPVKGNEYFTGYSNNMFEPNPCNVPDDERSELKDATAQYYVDIQLPSSAPLGAYDVKILSGLEGDWSNTKFAAKAKAINAFNVGECETSSEAENYETRFMSNQSFMTL